MNSCIPKISVIVPVYNCGKYLNQCLNSLKSQTFREFEVILVDDGSTDKSADIIKEFLKTDNRFTLIQKKNGGAGESRNIGINASRGEYLAFVDGDDFVDKKFLEVMYKAATESNADIVNCGFFINFEKSQKIKEYKKSLKNGCYDSDTALKYLLKDKKFRFYLWNKLWKKNLFTENNIQIPNMYYEDAVASTMLFYYAKTVVSIEYTGYYYMRTSSAYFEKSMSAERINDYINTVPIIRKFLEENNCYEKFKSSFSTHIFHVFFSIPALVIQSGKENENGVLKNTISGMSKVVHCCTVSGPELERIDLKNMTVK